MIAPVRDLCVMLMCYGQHPYFSDDSYRNTISAKYFEPDQTILSGRIWVQTSCKDCRKLCPRNYKLSKHVYQNSNPLNDIYYVTMIQYIQNGWDSSFISRDCMWKHNCVQSLTLQCWCDLENKVKVTKINLLNS